MTGTVTAFDQHVGLGEIEGVDGTRYAFHCTSIADGSRGIDPGARVRFAVVPGLPGRWEATAIERRQDA
jgi:cold shock CspA family protein